MSDEHKFRPQDEVDAKRPLADDGPEVEGHMFKQRGDDVPDEAGRYGKFGGARNEDPEAKRP
jgi:hypothetical protein